MTKYGSFSYTPFVMDNNVAHHNTIMTMYVCTSIPKSTDFNFHRISLGIPYPHKGHESV